MKKYKSASIIMSVLLAMSLFLAACGGGSGNASSEPPTESSASQTAAESSEPEEISDEDLVEITQIVWDRGTIPSDQGTLEDNWWVNYVNEQVRPLGIKVKYVIIPKAQNTELLSTMMAGNNAPDLVRSDDMPLIKSYISKGGIADMTPYLEEYGQNILNFYSEDELKDGQVDGKQYMLFHKQNDLMNTTFVRKDWLDALNIPVPTNPQEFKEMLMSIKENDPGNVGSALTPFAMISQSFNYWDVVVLPAFVEEEPTAEKLLTPRIMWPEAKECLRYLNDLFNSGLLTDELILDKDTSLFKQKVSRGELAAFVSNGAQPYHSAYGNLYDTLRENQPDAELTAIWPWQNSKGENYYQIYDNRPTYGYKWFIPSSCEHVDAVVKYLDWMCSEEGYMTACLGIEGEDYEIVDDVPKSLVDTANSRVTWIEPQYGTMGKLYNGKDDKDKFIKNYIKDFNPDYYDEILANTKCLSEVKYYKPSITESTPITDEVSSTLTQLLNDNLGNIICAPAEDFDKVFDDFLEEYKANGGQESADELINAYHQQMGE